MLTRRRWRSGFVRHVALFSGGRGATFALTETWPHASSTAELSPLPDPGRSEDLGEALPPARMGRAPAEFPLGLGVRGTAALRRHHHRSLAGEDPGQPTGDATGRLRPDD